MKILLIGNKNIDKDISEQIAQGGFDLIVRYNRMTNFDKTHTPYTHILLVDIGSWCEWQYAAQFEKCRDKFANVGKYLTFKHGEKSMKTFWKMLGKKGATCLEVKDFESLNIKKFFPNYKFNPDKNGGAMRITNAVWMVIYLLETFKKDELFITAIDYKDRSFLSSEVPHKNMYHYEETFLQNLIDSHQVTPVFYDE